MEEFPKIIYQTDKTFQKDAGDKWKEKHSDWKYVMMGDKECIDFLSNEPLFGERYVKAFEALRPGAFKSDLVRICWLYVNGGVYIDMDLIGTPDFDLNKLIEETQPADVILVKECPNGKRRRLGIYNAFMVVKKESPLIKAMIDGILKRIEKRYGAWGFASTGITGPIAVGEIIRKIYNLFRIPTGKIEPVRSAGAGSETLYILEEVSVSAGPSGEANFVILDKNKKHILMRDKSNESPNHWARMSLRGEIYHDRKSFITQKRMLYVVLVIFLIYCIFVAYNLLILKNF